MTPNLKKQEILNQIAAILNHPGWKVSSGSTEPRNAFVDIAENIGVPITRHDSKRSIARSIVESWGMDWYPTYESTGETITRLGLSAVLEAVKLATNQTGSSNLRPTNHENASKNNRTLESRTIQLGEPYRFPDFANSEPDLEFMDGSKNWFYYTDAQTKDLRGLRPQAGIWNPQAVRTESKEDRIPFIFCTTYPDRAGSFETPWHDEINLDEGRALYYGDNKDPDCLDPSMVRGNRIMLKNQKLQHSASRSDRELASPVLLVRAHGGNGLNYGFRTPIGLGVIWRSERVEQKNEKPRSIFLNLRYEIFFLDLSADHHLIDMRWIHARRKIGITSAAANRYAPSAWTTFVEEGISSLPRIQLSNH